MREWSFARLLSRKLDRLAGESTRRIFVRPTGRFSYGRRRSGVPRSSGRRPSKKPSMFSHAGFFVLATSYSRTACRRTTIGAAAFHFRVRNGNGWSHCARVTRVRCRTGGVVASKPVPNSGDDVDLGKNYQLSTINCCRSADIYIQEFISAETADG